MRRTIDFSWLNTDIKNQYKIAADIHRQTDHLSAIVATLPDCELRGTLKAIIENLHKIAEDLVQNAIRTTFGFGIAVRALEDNGWTVIGGFI